MRKVSTRIAAFAALGVLAIGGASATAASHWLITSTHQIKPSVLKQLKGKDGAPGAAGLAGAPGAPGTPGVSGRVIVSQQVDIPAYNYQTSGTQTTAATATCPAGKSLLGSGYKVYGSTVYLNGGIVPADTSVTANFSNYDVATGSVVMYAICAAVS